MEGIFNHQIWIVRSREPHCRKKIWKNPFSLGAREENVRWSEAEIKTKSVFWTTIRLKIQYVGFQGREIHFWCLKCHLMLLVSENPLMSRITCITRKNTCSQHCTAFKVCIRLSWWRQISSAEFQLRKSSGTCNWSSVGSRTTLHVLV